RSSCLSGTRPATKTHAFVNQLSLGRTHSMPSPGVAVVSGGASGIGEAAARRLASDGYHIAILDVNATGGEAVAKSIGASARFFACDVSDADAVQAMADLTEQQLGPA